jgi:hypothetical protein
MTSAWASAIPSRVSDTLSFDLTQGDVSEQTLYDETTHYIDYYYNRARILNRSAARLAMSIFQRRLASSTYALLKSFERRLGRLKDLIESIRSGKISVEQLTQMQRKLDETKDVLDEETGDEESPKAGKEENELTEHKAMGGVVAVSLAELIAEQKKVEKLLDLAKKVDAKGDESKFEKLREVLEDPQSRDEKLIIFTEHRDTLHYLVRRLEGLGFTGQVARIHGGMEFREREEQIEFFRKKTAEGGAIYMVCTDAAGEGINLQFAWRLLNWDIPWNPARLEQRMGRIHRYKQQHDPVIIINLIAGKTREGRVMKTLLDKLERIRKELRNDKVFDVIGRLFEGVSIKQYMEQAVSEEGAQDAALTLEGMLTKEQVEALEARERRLYGDGGDVKSALAYEREKLQRESWRRLLPGYVRRFIEKSAPLLHLQVDGDLDSTFAFKPATPGALDFLWNLLETYPPARRNCLTVVKPRESTDAIFLHPGEPVFERLRTTICGRFADHALRGGIFVDPQADRPYLFHLASVSIVRSSDTSLRALGKEELLEERLLGFRQTGDGLIHPCPVEHLLLLRGDQTISPPTNALFPRTAELVGMARDRITEEIAEPLVQERRQRCLDTLATRIEFVTRGYEYQESDLAAMRGKLNEKVRAGDLNAKKQLSRVRDRQKSLHSRKKEALESLRREPDLIHAAAIEFLAHALVLPSDDPEDQKRFDAQVEAIAMKIALAHEEANGAIVKDVSKPNLARAAGLTDNPGFDLLSLHAVHGQKGIEVKGRAGIGDVELTENEWAKACNERDRYWLYVVYDCASPSPRLMRVKDPFRKLIARAKGSVVLSGSDIFSAAEVE